MGEIQLHIFIRACSEQNKSASVVTDVRDSTSHCCFQL